MDPDTADSEDPRDAAIRHLYLAVQLLDEAGEGFAALRAVEALDALGVNETPVLEYAEPIKFAGGARS